MTNWKGITQTALIVLVVAYLCAKTLGIVWLLMKNVILPGIGGG